MEIFYIVGGRAFKGIRCTLILSLLGVSIMLRVSVNNTKKYFKGFFDVRLQNLLYITLKYPFSHVTRHKRTNILKAMEIFQMKYHIILFLTLTAFKTSWEKCAGSVMRLERNRGTIKRQHKHKDSLYQ